MHKNMAKIGVLLPILLPLVAFLLETLKIYPRFFLEIKKKKIFLQNGLSSSIIVFERGGSGGRE